MKILISTLCLLIGLSFMGCIITCPPKIACPAEDIVTVTPEGKPYKFLKGQLDNPNHYYTREEWNAYVETYWRFLEEERNSI